MNNIRENYTADWAFSARGSIENVVKENFPNEAHRWPLLRTFDFEVFTWQRTHLILILRNKYSGIPAGPGIPKPLEDPDAPSEIPKPDNIFIWHKYLREKFTIGPEDLVMVITIDDEAVSLEEEWKKWPKEYLELWSTQISINIRKHFYHLKGFDLIGDFFIPPGYSFLANDCEKLLVDHPDYNKNCFVDYP